MNTIENENPLKGVWRASGSIDWSDQKYSLNKAHVCALFSEFAYWVIPEFEMKDHDRVKIIPCLNYQKIVMRGGKYDYTALVMEAELPEYFVIIRRYAIAFGVRFLEYIIISIRGTKFLYDWLTNLNALSVSVRNRGQTLQFHRGFFRAARSLFQPLTMELNQIIDDPVPIYVTGHSLGGAIAAIVFGVWKLHLTDSKNKPNDTRRIVTPHSSYTFGMPRYANFSTIVSIRTPFHIYNEKDIVPDVPPRFAGFENCTHEYLLDGEAIERMPRIGGREFATWLWRLSSGQGVGEHSVELYRSRLESIVDQT